MNIQDEPLAIYTCDRTKINPLVDRIIKSLPSLTKTTQSEIANAKRLHYKETPDIRIFSIFILKNVSFCVT